MSRTPPIGAVLTAESDWIEHDGKSVPVRGVLVDVRTVGTGEWSGWVADQWGVSWLWTKGEEPDASDIIAYRVVPSQAQEPSVPAGEGELRLVGNPFGTGLSEPRLVRSLPAPEASGAGGWRLVPVEPTPEMATAIAKAVREAAIPTSIDPDEIYFDNGHARTAYRAMLSAAPVQADSTEGVGA